MSANLDLFQLARDLISRESTTGNEEPVVAYLEVQLREMGLTPRSEEVSPGRRNLYAGPERPAVLFCTHTDTVPPFVPLREDEDYLYGRGACDTKGIQACMLEAGRRLLAAGRRDFGYLFVVGEEVDNIGARRANRSVRSRYVVVGEPTENRVAVGHKGVLAGRLRARGVACHSAYPQRGDSALHRLLDGIARLRQTDFGVNEVLGSATTNIGEVHGGVAPNVVAPFAEASFAVRLVGDIEEAEKRLLRCFCDVETGEPDPQIDVEIRSRMPVPRLERVEGFPETVVAFGTDVPFLADVGKAVLFGPGSIFDAHTAGEKIAKSAMLEAVGCYVDLATRLADSPVEPDSR